MNLELEAPVSPSRIAPGQSRGTEVVSRTPQPRPAAPDPVRAANDASARTDQVPDEAPTSTSARQLAGFTPANDWTQLADALGIRSPMRAAVVLLGLYIAMYLAVAGVFHALASPDAAATFAAGHTLTSLSFATAFDRRAAEGSPANGIAVPIDSSRECATSKAIDSECIYN